MRKTLDKEAGGLLFRRCFMTDSTACQNCTKTRPSVRVHWVACGTRSVPRNFFSSWGGGGGGEGGGGGRVTQKSYQKSYQKPYQKPYQQRPFGSQVLTRSYDETDPFLRLKTWLPAY